MENQLKILGVLYLIAGAFFLVLALVIATALTGTGLLTGELGVFALLSGLGMALAIFLVISGLPSLVLGWAMLKRRPWARLLGFVVAVLNLANFPLGTLLSIYTIWVLLQPEATALLRDGNLGGAVSAAL